MGDTTGHAIEIRALKKTYGAVIVDYSHGMQKKLSFAAALIHDPRVLFLDERAALAHGQLHVGGSSAEPPGCIAHLVGVTDRDPPTRRSSLFRST